MKLFDEIQKNFPDMEKLFSKDNLRCFACSDYSQLSDYHFGFGTWIRNNILAKNEVLISMFFKIRVKNFDDMSLIIIHLFYIYINEKENFIA